MGTTPSHFIVCSAGTCGHRTSCSSIEFLLSPDEDCGLSTPMIHPRQQVTKLGIGIKLPVGTASPSNHKTFTFCTTMAFRHEDCSLGHIFITIALPHCSHRRVGVSSRGCCSWESLGWSIETVKCTRSKRCAIFCTVILGRSW
jgi:hypothetical protein